MGMQIESSLENFAPAAVLEQMTDGVRLQIAQNIAGIIRQRWIQLANGVTASSRQTYTQSIQELRTVGDAVVVSLEGEEANALEHGTPAYDMRTTLLGPNVPVVQRGSGQRGKQQSKSGGYYRAIPFRQQVPGQGNKSPSGIFAQPMGQAYQSQLGKDAAKALGKAIYKAARQLTATLSEPNRLQKQATDGKGFAKMEPVKYGKRLAAGVGGVTKLKPHHQTDIYAGMIRAQDTYGKATQNSYMTFRTISTTKQVGWMHKATEGLGLMKKIAQELPSIGATVLSAFVEGATGQTPRSTP